MVARFDRKRGYATLRGPHDSIPKIPKELQKAPEKLASRFFQLASGHAMIAPLKEKLRWIRSNICWWCGSGRQTREHLFKERLTWKKDTRELWEEVGEATVMEKETIGRNRYKGRKGFYVGRQGGGHNAALGPGSTPIRVLMSDEKCIPAVLRFLDKTGCGKLKEGVVLTRQTL